MSPTDILIALAIVSIWGLNFVVIKIGLQDFSPISLTVLRFFFAAFPLVFFIKRPAIPWRLLCAFGLFQFTLQFTLLFSGMQLGLTPGLASLVMQLQVFFTIGFAILFLGERPRITQLLGALIAFSGMALVAYNLESKATLIGFLLVITASSCWATANIVTKKIGKVNPLALMVWGSLVALPPLIVASLLMEGAGVWVTAAHHLNWRAMASVLYQAYPNTMFAFGAWAVLMRKYPTATVAPFTLLVPVIGMFCAALILDEALQWWKIVACMLVLGGLAFNQFGQRWLSGKASR
ncbi:EamA family transporter [Herminiimonas arsenitoxidans]|uniref:EamA family transporter n=1 Tax=Herminiimonas arsenitoxidans TaxID=1809410 RepID=UPI000970D941|nr:EamA family transporter [Herminiimonas arsenitoxidans]